MEERAIIPLGSASLLWQGLEMWFIYMVHKVANVQLYA